MNEKQICYRKALELLIEYNNLAQKDFVKLLIAMDFSKEAILSALNNLCENPLVEYKLGNFKSLYY